jgi:hypothetical protein
MTTKIKAYWTASNPIALAAAGVACIAMLSPASAGNKTPPPRSNGHPAPIQATLGARDRTAGCSYHTSGRGTWGCSSNTCSFGIAL